jgi:hypothetical protein
MMVLPDVSADMQNWTLRPCLAAAHRSPHSNLALAQSIAPGTADGRAAWEVAAAEHSLHAADERLGSLMAALRAAGWQAEQLVLEGRKRRGQW